MPVYMKLEGAFAKGDGSVRIYCGDNVREVESLLKVNIPLRSVTRAVLNWPKPGPVAQNDFPNSKLLNSHPAASGLPVFYQALTKNETFHKAPAPTPDLLQILIGLLRNFMAPAGKVLLDGFNFTPAQLAGYQTGGVPVLQTPGGARTAG